MTAHMVQQDQTGPRRYPHLLQCTVQHSTTWQGQVLRVRHADFALKSIPSQKQIRRSTDSCTAPSLGRKCKPTRDIRTGGLGTLHNMGMT